MAVTIYYENDVDPKIIQGKKVAIIGYGSQAMPMPSTSWIPASTCASACARVPRAGLRPKRPV